MIKLSIAMPIYNSEDTLLDCLNSIPKRDDVEVLCCDDCSTDNSGKILNDGYNNNKNNFANIILYRNENNLGIGPSKNLMYNNASGEYITAIDSDDYLYTDKYCDAIDELYKTNDDVIFISNDINNGDVGDHKRLRYATWCYFCKTNFLKNNDIQVDKIRFAEDEHLYKDIMSFNPKISSFNLVVYHYNFPRLNSMTWIHFHDKKGSGYDRGCKMLQT